ncbi:MAG: hypothetical protein HOZ81_12405, partial [Streptomyces sp.]|nr:hypothetical protein [Streptomyces sp.]
LAYEALLSGIGKYVAKVGRRFRGIAERLGRGKGDKGDGKRPTTGGADGKGDKKGDERPADGTPESKPPTVRPTSVLPEPGKGTGPGTKPQAKPDPRADAKKPTTKTPTTKTPTTKPPGKDTAPGKSKDDKTGDAKKPTATDTSTRPMDKPGTRPTPVRKPEPKPDLDTKPKSADGKSPAKPKDDRDTPGATKPKDDKGAPGRSKDQDPTRTKDSTKPKGDEGKKTKREDGKRSKEDDGKKTKHEDGRKSKHDGGKKTKHDGDNRKKDSDRGKDRQDKKDQRKKEEEQTKDERLDDIVRRIRRILRKRLEPGMPRAAHDRMLDALRRYYRLTSLTKEGHPKFNIRATLNPEEDVLKGFSQEMTDYLEQQRLPDPEITPQPKMGTPPGAVTKAAYVNAEWAGRNGAAPSGQYTEGFTYLDDHTFNAPGKPQWDRMHLIPRQVGGPAKTSNFVPALNSINRPFYESFEKFAAMTFGSVNNNPDNVGWYQVDLTRWQGSSPHGYPGRGADPEKYAAGDYPPGFPRSFTASWGLYGKKPGADGRNRSDWKEFNAITSATLNIPAPPIPGSRPAPVNINTATKQELKEALKQTNNFVLAVQEVRDQEYARGLPSRSQPFSGIGDMHTKLKRWRSPKGMPVYSLDEVMKQVEERHRAGHFTF